MSKKKPHEKMGVNISNIETPPRETANLSGRSIRSFSADDIKTKRVTYNTA